MKITGKIKNSLMNRMSVIGVSNDIAFHRDELSMRTNTKTLHSIMYNANNKDEFFSSGSFMNYKDNNIVTIFKDTDKLVNISDTSFIPIQNAENIGHIDYYIKDNSGGFIS